MHSYCHVPGYMTNSRYSINQWFPYYRGFRRGREAMRRIKFPEGTWGHEKNQILMSNST
jgi:hypothetical protein